MTPREGEAGFSSAMTLMPSRESAAAKSRSGVAALTPYLSAVSGQHVFAMIDFGAARFQNAVEDGAGVDVGVHGLSCMLGCAG